LNPAGEGGGRGQEKVLELEEELKEEELELERAFPIYK